MCLYVTYPLHLISVPNVISAKATAQSGEKLYHFPYTAGTNYEAAASAKPNTNYAQTGPHPSDLSVSAHNPGILNSELKIDSEIPLGATTTIKPTVLYDSTLVGLNSAAPHHYTETTCENIGKCAPGDLVGKACTGKSHTFTAKGFCYESASGTKECGRSLQAWGRLNPGVAAPKQLPYSMGDAVSRCPAGTALTYPGTKKVRSLLVGGCMKPGDANFKSTAQVHVPGDCAAPSDYMKGCMFPGARNYFPGALQPGKCLYNVNGCTTLTALNYNSEAQVDDGSCVNPKPGCTLKEAGYDGVDADTPMYKQRYGSQNTRTQAPTLGGRLIYPAYKSVQNYDPAANVLSGCKVIIEGCQDPTAANYDSKANSNSMSWCVPVRTGCMMPPVQALSVATSVTGSRKHLHDGGSSSFDPAATRNSVASCKIYRTGCNETGALNVDSKVTVNDGSCWHELTGCLDRSAMNFNCSSLDFFEECTPTGKSRPTKHDAGACNYAFSPPPIASPAFPPGAATGTAVTVNMVVAGTLETELPKRPIYARAFAFAAKVAENKVTVNMEAGSVQITAVILVDDSSEEATVKTNVEGVFTSPEASTAFFKEQGIGDVQVLSTPVIETKEVVLVTPPAPPPEGPTGAIVGAVIGIVVAIFLLGGIGFIIYRRKKQATYPA